MRILLPAVRSFHSAVRIFTQQKSASSPFLYTTGPADLESKIDAFLLEPLTNTEKETTHASVVDALKACRLVLRAIDDHDKFGLDPARTTVRQGIDKLLLSERVNFDSQLLKSIFLLEFPPSSVIAIIEAYYKRNPSAAIDLQLALIPLRNCLYNAQLKDALTITDLTTGHKNYVLKKNAVMRTGLYRLAATALGITATTKFGTQFAVDSGFLLEAWTNLASLNAIILTYVLNSSFFVTLVKFGRQLSTAGGDYLAWQKGTFYTDWYRYSDLMAMCAKIVETDMKLNGGVASSSWLIEEMTRSDPVMGNGFTLSPGVNREGKRVRLLEARENLEDLKMQAYWMTGGDGFEWVEPDQDPAEIQWRNHLEHLHSPAVNLLDAKSLKWAEDLIEEKDLIEETKD